MFQIPIIEVLAGATVLMGDMLAVFAVGCALIALVLRFLNQRDDKYLPASILAICFGLVGYYARLNSADIPLTTNNGALLPMSNPMLLLLLVAAIFFLVARAVVGRLSTS
jgi:hypothetical protein